MKCAPGQELVYMEVYKGMRIYHSLARFCRKKVLKGELMFSSLFYA